jgi:hypothetical protein
MVGWLRLDFCTSACLAGVERSFGWRASFSWQSSGLSWLFCVFRSWLRLFAVVLLLLF